MTPLRTSETKIVGTLLLSQSLLSASMILIFTVSSIEAVEMAGGDAAWTGVPSTVTLIASALVAYPIGWLMDRAGRRIGLTLGHLIGAGGALVSAWAVVTRSLPVFLLGVFILGLARGALELGRYAAADASPPARRGRAISLVVLGGTVGSVAGPSLIALAYWLAPRLNMPEIAAPWVMAAGFSALGAALLTLFLRPDPQQIARQMEALYGGQTPDATPQPPAPIGRSTREVMEADWRARLAVGAMIFSQLSMVIVMTITPVHMNDHQHGIGAISWVIMGHTFGMFGLSFATGWLVDRVGRVRMIFAGGVISALACALAPFSTSVGWLALTLFLLGLGWNFCFVAGSTLLDDALHPAEKGRIQGSSEALVKAASGLGSLGSGVLFAASSFALTSWLTVVAAILPSLLVIVWAGRRMSEGQAATETVTATSQGR